MCKQRPEIMCNADRYGIVTFCATQVGACDAGNAASYLGYFVDCPSNAYYGVIEPLIGTKQYVGWMMNKMTYDGCKNGIMPRDAVLSLCEFTREANDCINGFVVELNGQGKQQAKFAIHGRISQTPTQIVIEGLKSTLVFNQEMLGVMLTKPLLCGVCV